MTKERVRKHRSSPEGAYNLYNLIKQGHNDMHEIKKIIGCNVQMITELVNFGYVSRPVQGRRSILKTLTLQDAQAVYDAYWERRQQWGRVRQEQFEALQARKEARNGAPPDPELQIEPVQNQLVIVDDLSCIATIARRMGMSVLYDDNSIFIERQQA